MPRRTVAVLSLWAAVAAAQQPQLEPLPEPPPAPASPAPDEPAVRIPVQEGDKVEAIRQGARVVMVKVTPAKGRPYYLIDTSGNGNWMRRNSLDDGVRVPMWPVYIFD